jgi:hypothetical protein
MAGTEEYSATDADAPGTNLPGRRAWFRKQFPHLGDTRCLSLCGKPWLNINKPYTNACVGKAVRSHVPTLALVEDRCHPTLEFRVGPMSRDCPSDLCKPRGVSKVGRHRALPGGNRRRHDVLQGMGFIQPNPTRPLERPACIQLLDQRIHHRCCHP